MSFDVDLGYPLTHPFCHTQAKYILDAVMFVADHGPSFLPLYRANIVTGEWTSIVCPISMHGRVDAR